MGLDITDKIGISFDKYSDNSLADAYISYNPDKDINEHGGGYGIELAESIIKRSLQVGLDANTWVKLVKNKDNPKNNLFDSNIYYGPRRLSKFHEIISRPFPPTEPGEHVGVREYKMRFSELRRAGYIFEKPYSRLNLRKTREFFQTIKKDIHSQLRN